MEETLFPSPYPPNYCIIILFFSKLTTLHSIFRSIHEKRQVHHKKLEVSVYMIWIYIEYFVSDISLTS